MQRSDVQSSHLPWEPLKTLGEQILTAECYKFYKRRNTEHKGDLAISVLGNLQFALSYLDYLPGTTEHQYVLIQPMAKEELRALSVLFIMFPAVLHLWMMDAFLFFTVRLPYNTSEMPIPLSHY